MSNFLDSVTGPLNKNSCVYFYVWSLFFFIVLVITFITHIIILFKDYKKLSGHHILSAVVILINLFLAYFVNRLFLTMCNKSLA